VVYLSVKANKRLVENKKTMGRMAVHESCDWSVCFQPKKTRKAVDFGLCRWWFGGEVMVVVVLVRRPSLSFSVCGGCSTMVEREKLAIGNGLS
jgi:hypothetical protein